MSRFLINGKARANLISREKFRNDHTQKHGEHGKYS